MLPVVETVYRVYWHSVLSLQVFCKSKFVSLLLKVYWKSWAQGGDRHCVCFL